VAEITEIFSVLEARGLRSRCQQDRFLPAALSLWSFCVLIVIRLPVIVTRAYFADLILITFVKTVSSNTPLSEVRESLGPSVRMWVV
jgi:hypothetical protein